MPDAGHDDVLVRGDDAERMRVILALLRAADALDGRVVQSPQLVFALIGQTLKVTCYLNEECPKARRVYGRRKKFRLLEEVLGIVVDINVTHAEALELVA